MKLPANLFATVLVAVSLSLLAMIVVVEAHPAQEIVCQCCDMDTTGVATDECGSGRGKPGHGGTESGGRIKGGGRHGGKRGGRGRHGGESGGHFKKNGMTDEERAERLEERLRRQERFAGMTREERKEAKRIERASMTPEERAAMRAEKQERMAERKAGKKRGRMGAQRVDLTEEEREAKRAERYAEQVAFFDALSDTEQLQMCACMSQRHGLECTECPP